MSAFEELGSLTDDQRELLGFKYGTPRNGADGSHMLASEIADSLGDLFRLANEGIDESSPHYLSVDHVFNGFLQISGRHGTTSKQASLISGTAPHTRHAKEFNSLLYVEDYDFDGPASVGWVISPIISSLREQIRAGVFPVRLKADEWASGEINWLLDGEPSGATGPSRTANAPTRDGTASVIANFKQVVKDGDLRLHPLITQAVDKETLEKMGAKKVGDET